METVIDVPFTYTELFDTAIRGIRGQNDLAQESSEISEFWNMLQGFQTAGKCVDKAHYRIRYLRSFRSTTSKTEMQFNPARPILYLNKAAIMGLFSSRSPSSTANRSNWSTLLSYLTSHASYLGLKQDRFILLLPNGQPDYTVETVGGQQVKKVKVSRPNALCFDYQMLKDKFGLQLETEVLPEGMADEQDDTDTGHDTPGKSNPSQPEALPF